MNDPLSALAARYGIHSDYVGLDGNTHATSPATIEVLLAAMGVDGATGPKVETGPLPGWRVVVARE